MKSAWIATKFLTIAGRFGAAPGSPEQIGSAVVYFPFVGFALGGLLILLNRIVNPFFESEIAAAVLILALIVLTAALHLEGTQKTFDLLLASPRANENVSAISIYGVLAVVLVIIFKIRAVEVMGETRPAYLLLAPAVARWALIIFLYGTTWAREEATWRIAEKVTALHLVISSLIILAVAVYLTGRAGLWVGLSISTLALLSRSYLQKRLGGLTHHQFGALIEISETLGLVLFASL